jgi:DNA phosphorothioation-dependent restriction protein DptH
MSYFARTLRDHLKVQIDRFCSEASHGRKMIFMVPAMPEKTMLSVADAVTSQCLQDHNLLLTLKIAATLTEKWSSAGQQAVQAKGWKDERGNLTYYRNLPETTGKCSLIVLCGADRVTDAAGLADFHTCDPELLWRTDMRESFKGWMLEKLKASGIHDCSMDDLATFDRIIKPVLGCGRGDLLQISEWLETLNINQAADVADIPRIMLGALRIFGVPVLARFPLGQKRKQISLYITKSAEFFNYTLFLEDRQRDKAIKAIDKILAVIAEGDDPGLPLDDEDVRGAYGSGEEFLRGLKKYIETDNAPERNRLMECDFVVIWDQILKFKIKEPKKDRDSVCKLSGSPVEVLLTATWLTLRDFFLENKGEAELKIDAISITTNQFKHDVDSGDDKEENAEQARAYLERLIGGIDPLITQHVNLCNADGSDIMMKCDLLAPGITCVYSKSAEPVLEFIVEIPRFEKAFKRKYGWRMPEHHTYRLSADLLLRAECAIEKMPGIYKLPVYHVSYYEELLQATADEEIRRVLLHSIRDERDNKQVLTNLLAGPWAQETDPLSGGLKALAEKYHNFICNATKHGVFATVFGGQSTWAELRKAYSDVFEAASALDDINQSSMVGMLVRAFLVVGSRPLSLGDTWHADVHERSGVATILHPSVVEMLEAQVVYLCRCFNYAANKELGHTPGKDSFSPHIWRSYVDLSSIQSPLAGLLHNEEKNLTAKVRGQELIHRIGSSDETETPLSTRLLLQYNENPDEDDSFSDTEMFRETSESKLLLRLMQDYFDLHPHARDGLSVAVFRNKDIQPVIAAVHAYLKILAQKPTAQQANKRYVLSPDRERPYAISVTLFTESNDETDVSSWVQQWRERWEAAETESKYELYRRCRFSIAHRIVEKNGLSSFAKLINEQFEADIAVFYNFIGVGEGVNHFEKVAPFDITSRDLKFPILEKACCTISNPAEKYRRKRVVSNRQFSLSAYHANLLHALQSGAHQTGTVVIGSGDFTPWRMLIDCLHKKAEWIICVDPNMDERLIKTPLTDTAKAREIIGFGSGVGSHGEDNYTVSTERFSLSDIYTRLRASIQQLYAPGAGWSVDACDEVAKGILQVAPELSGLSLVRATGVGDEYIRDFMAYALTRKMLRADVPPLCESLISLDAYRHWFDLSENMRRPDLMWMRAEVGPNRRFHIKMQLIECKLGQASIEHVTKAKSQIDNGLYVLSSAFAPLDTDSFDAGIKDERPDRRYWWMQLHRLVASKAEVDRSLYPDVLAALERLAEGDFDISWSASVFAFWVNQEDDIKRIGFWNTGDAPEVTANVYSIGGGFVRKLVSDSGMRAIDWSAFTGQGQELTEDEGGLIAPEVDDDYTPWEEEDAEEETEEEGAVETLSSIPEYVLVPAPEPVPEEREAERGSVTGTASIAATPAAVPNSPPVDAAKIIPPTTVSASVAPDQSGRILLGKTVNNNQPVCWEFHHPQLANRHMIIFGAPGQGKTYAIQGLLCEMRKFGQHSLIIDYTNGFLPNHLEEVTKAVLKPKQHVVRNEPLPINPFLPQVSDNGGIIIQENSNTVAKRIAGLFDAVYGLGNQQYSVLHRAIMTGVETMSAEMNMDHMLDVIETMAGDKQFKSYAQSLHSKLRPFVLDKPFSSGEASFDWDHIFLEQQVLCNIFQMAGMDMYSAKLITEFILWDLYGHLQSKGKKTDPKVIVLDEVQNLDHREGSPLSKYLREGRKFGVSLVLATQTMSGVKKDERDRMFMADHKLFFKPADTELKAFAEIASLATRQKADVWLRNLSSLQKGECYSIGGVLDSSSGKLVPRALKIRITPLEERGFDE